MSISIEDIPVMVTHMRERHSVRLAKNEEVAGFVRGDTAVYDPDDEELEVVTPNYIQVAAEDTADASALMPTVRSVPWSMEESVKRSSDRMEAIGTSFLEAWNMALILPLTVGKMSCFGLGAWVILPDEKSRIPMLTMRDPRTVFTETGGTPGSPVERGFTARDVYLSQVPEKYRAKLKDHGLDKSSMIYDPTVTLVEYFDDTEYIVAGYFSGGTAAVTIPGGGSVTPVEFERREHHAGACPLVVGARQTILGDELPGQFDQVLSSQKAHARLAAMMLDYADQAVYADMWVKDSLGEVATGGGSMIRLGPNGAIGRVPPAATSFSVGQDLALVEDGIHLGARWPKNRPGDISQSIASAKFMEATVGLMNTNIKAYHMVLKQMLEHALNLAFAMDVHWFSGVKMMSGVLRNQSFIEEYDTADIDLKNRVRVEYGLGLGRDESQAAVLHIQYGQGGYISKEFVQENIPGVVDVGRERARIDVEQVEDMMRAKLNEGVQAGMIPNRALVEIHRARLDGKSLADVFEEFVIAPEEELAANTMTSGLDPTKQIGPGGAPPPGAPPETGLGQPPVPGAPAPNEVLNRLGVNAGDGSVLGSEVRS